MKYLKRHDGHIFSHTPERAKKPNFTEVDLPEPAPEAAAESAAAGSGDDVADGAQKGAKKK